MDIDPKEEEDEDSSEELDDIMLLFGTEDMEKTLGHNHGRIMTYDREDILHPLVDTLSDGGIDSLVVKLHRTREWCECKGSMGVFFICGCGIRERETVGVRDIIISNDIRCLLVHERKRSDDDMGRDPRLEKREDVRDEDIVLFRYDNLSETFVEMIVVAFRFSFVFLYSLNPRKGFGSFRLGGFGLLFRTALRSAFITVKIIETVESHIGISY